MYAARGFVRSFCRIDSHGNVHNFGRHLAVGNYFFVHRRSVTSRFRYEELSVTVGMDGCRTETNVLTEDGDESNERMHRLQMAFDDLAEEAAICVQSSSDEEITGPHRRRDQISSLSREKVPSYCRLSIGGPSSQLENILHIEARFQDWQFSYFSSAAKSIYLTADIYENETFD